MVRTTRAFNAYNRSFRRPSCEAIDISTEAFWAKVVGILNRSDSEMAPGQLSLPVTAAQLLQAVEQVIRPGEFVPSGSGEGECLIAAAELLLWHDKHGWRVRSSRDEEIEETMVALTSKSFDTLPAAEEAVVDHIMAKAIEHGFKTAKLKAQSKDAWSSLDFKTKVDLVTAAFKPQPALAS